jgi:hypothetical protein
VREPLVAWLSDRWGPGTGRRFSYEVHGTERPPLTVQRLHAD